MGKIKVLFPFKDGEEIWLGLDTPGFRRKVFRTVNKDLVTLHQRGVRLAEDKQGRLYRAD